MSSFYRHSTVDSRSNRRLEPASFGVINDHFGGQTRRNFFDLLLDILNRFERIEAVANDGHATHCFRSRFVQGTAP